MATPPRRLPAPWTVTPFEGGFAVQDARGVPLAFVYHVTGAASPPDMLTAEDARLVATGIAHLPDLLRMAEQAALMEPQEPPRPAVIPPPVPDPPPAARDDPRGPAVASKAGAARLAERAQPDRPARRGPLMRWMVPASLMLITLVVLLQVFDEPATGRPGEPSSLRKLLLRNR
jgi:hypothetical protein